MSNATVLPLRECDVLSWIFLIKLRLNEWAIMRPNFSFFAKFSRIAKCATPFHLSICKSEWRRSCFTGNSGSWFAIDLRRVFRQTTLVHLLFGYIRVEQTARWTGQQSYPEMHMKLSLLVVVVVVASVRRESWHLSFHTPHSDNALTIIEMCLVCEGSDRTINNFAW